MCILREKVPEEMGTVFKKVPEEMGTTSSATNKNAKRRRPHSKVHHQAIIS
jgi:hypothetical protein